MLPWKIFVETVAVLCYNRRWGDGVIIRQEQSSDYNEVYQLVKMSFATTPDDDGTTQDYLSELRTKDVFIPELSLVAESDEGTLVGQVVLYKTTITTPQRKLTELLLSPICVHPDYFGRGIARAMVEEALRIARNIGYRAVFLCGDPEIYSKMGFVATYRYNIFHKDEETAEWSMVRELHKGALDGISGTINTI